MQNRAAIAANATQHEIVQKAAEQRRLEDKAGKQLERVQQQMALFVWPFNMAQAGHCKPAKTQAISPSPPSEVAKNAALEYEPCTAARRVRLSRR